MLRYPPSFMSLPCIFCKRMHLQYIEAFLVSTPAGALPQTPASLAAPQGQAVKTQPPDPVAKVLGRLQGVKGKKCTASPPLTPLHLRESSKTIRSGRELENLSRLAKQPLAAWPLQVGGDPTLQGKGAGGFPCTPATWRTRVGQRPRCWQDPLGSRSRGTVCRRHSF